MTEEVKQPETSTSNCKCKVMTWIAGIIVCSVFLLIFLNAIMSNHNHSNPRIKCISNLKQVGVWLLIYAEDNEHTFPAGTNLAVFTKLTNPGCNQNIFFCPASSQTPCKFDATLKENNISYVYLSEKFEKNSSLASKIPIVFDYPLNHKKSTGWFSKPEHYINVLFCDGHVEPFKTDAKTCVEFIDVLHKKFKYSPDVLKRLKEKAAQADREQVPHKR